MSEPGPVTRFFGGLLQAVGIIIALLSGLCTLAGMAFSGADAGIVALALGIGILPFGIGVAMILIGRAMRPPPPPAAGQSVPPQDVS